MWCPERSPFQEQRHKQIKLVSLQLFVCGYLEIYVPLFVYVYEISVFPNYLGLSFFIGVFVWERDGERSSHCLYVRYLCYGSNGKACLSSCLWVLTAFWLLLSKAVPVKVTPRPYCNYIAWRVFFHLNNTCSDNSTRSYNWVWTWALDLISQDVTEWTLEMIAPPLFFFFTLFKDCWLYS